MRIKKDELAYYHCMTRVVDRQMLLGDEEKEHMRRLLRKIEGFTGVHVLTYAVMTNHLHVLLEEPDRATEIDDTTFWRRMACLYSEAELDEICGVWDRWRSEGCAELIALDRNRYLVRMHDISEFMKQLKQRFTRWYNRRHQRVGTLWEARFKSVLVEDGFALRIMSAYIEMNPVRAHMADEPQQYTFCGLGEAVGGGVAARRGIERIVSSADESVTGWADAFTMYYERILMYAEVRSNPSLQGWRSEDQPESAGNQAALDGFVRLLCRCRYFTDGQVIGSRDFVEQFFAEHRERFGPRRNSGARKVRGGWRDVFAIRDLLNWT